MALFCSTFLIVSARGDFASDKEYYDYEEWAEEITYNIVHNIDRAANEAKVQEFMKNNQAQIIERNKEMDLRCKLEKQQLLAEQQLADKRREEMIRQSAEV